MRSLVIITALFAAACSPPAPTTDAPAAEAPATSLPGPTLCCLPERVTLFGATPRKRCAICRDDAEYVFAGSRHSNKRQARTAA
jgi:hypothetical protein